MSWKAYLKGYLAPEVRFLHRDHGEPFDTKGTGLPVPHSNAG
jgi:hypothetical protein